MPIQYGQDRKGKYVRWGKQKKYYYSDKSSRKRAVKKAKQQAQAIYAA